MKLSGILTGYVIAFVVAVVVVAFSSLFAGGPEARAASGMSAFSDLLLFLAVFSVVALPPTVGALFALKPYPGFWWGLSVFAILVAPTSVVAFAAWNADPHSTAAEVGFLRILAAPFFVLIFALSGAIGRITGTRVVLFVAAGIEAVVFLGWMFLCIFRNT